MLPHVQPAGQRQAVLWVPWLHCKWGGVPAPGLASITLLPLCRLCNMALTHASLPAPRLPATRPPAHPSRTLYGEFLRSYTCPEWMGKEAVHVCTALLYQLNVNMPVEAAVNLTDQAIKRAFEKQGRPVPEQLFAAAQEAGSASSSSSSSSSEGGSSSAAAAIGEPGRQPNVPAAPGGGESTGQLPPRQARVSVMASAQLLLLGAAAGAVLAAATGPLVRQWRHRWR